MSNLQLGRQQNEIAKGSLIFTTEALNQSIQRQKLGTPKPFEKFWRHSNFSLWQNWITLIKHLSSTKQFSQSKYVRVMIYKLFFLKR